MNEAEAAPNILGALTMSRLRSEVGDETARRMVARMKEAMVLGESDERLSRAMQWNPETIGLLRQTVLEQEKALLRRPGVEAYIDYLYRQEGFIRDLNLVVDEYRQNPGEVKLAPAAVAAIRAKSEILDKVLKTGQDFGVIRKAATKKELDVVEGHSVAELSDTELRNLIFGLLKRMSKLVTQYGDFGGGAVEVPFAPVIGEKRGKAAHGGKGINRRKGGRATVRSAIVQRSKGMAPPV